MGARERERAWGGRDGVGLRRGWGYDLNVIFILDVINSYTVVKDENNSEDAKGGENKFIGGC